MNTSNTANDTTPAPAAKKLTPETQPELFADLKAAHAAGLAAAATIDDGGTCNFDSAVLAFESKAERRLAEAVITMAGGHCFEWKGFRKVLGLVVSLGAPGQGFKHTKYAEAFEKYLEAKGWPTTMYYQMD